jgi:hypothetical protein
LTVDRVACSASCVRPQSRSRVPDNFQAGTNEAELWSVISARKRRPAEYKRGPNPHHPQTQKTGGGQVHPTASSKLSFRSDYRLGVPSLPEESTPSAQPQKLAATRFTPQQVANSLFAQISMEVGPRSNPKYRPSAILKIPPAKVPVARRGTESPNDPTSKTTPAAGQLVEARPDGGTGADVAGTSAGLAGTRTGQSNPSPQTRKPATAKTGGGQVHPTASR